MIFRVNMSRDINVFTGNIEVRLAIPDPTRNTNRTRHDKSDTNPTRTRKRVEIRSTRNRHGKNRVGFGLIGRPDVGSGSPHSFKSYNFILVL